MNKIEKAVIDLGGEWPEGSGNTLCHLSSGGYYTSTNANDICTYDEFMAERKRLENKPSWEDAPKDADFLVQNSEGSWQFGKSNGADVVSGDYGGWKIKSVKDVNFVSPAASVGRVFGDWRQSLERRPEEKHEEDWVGVGKKVRVKATGEVKPIIKIDEDKGAFLGTGEWRCRTELAPHVEPQPQWVPGETLPPVGIECEYQSAIAGWGKVKILAKGKHEGVDAAVIQRPGGILIVTDPAFLRPIQSRRDKVIEAASKIPVVPVASARYTYYLDKEALGALYDAGALKIPEGE